MRIALGVEYNGFQFKGWQTQLGVRTVQDELDAALQKVADHEVSSVVAGRTDTGVHASYQVAHFDTAADRPISAWWRGVNTYLPRDMRVRWARLVGDDFHARFSALSRSYRYVLLNDAIPSAIFAQLVTQEYRELDVEAMRRAAEHLLGSHDFSSFRAAGCQARSPVRTVTSVYLGQSGPWLWLDISANAFLQHMVRNVVGALLEVGTGARAPAWIDELLTARDRTVAGVTAPPHGLYLTAVEYPDTFALPKPDRTVQYWET